MVFNYPAFKKYTKRAAASRIQSGFREYKRQQGFGYRVNKAKAMGYQALKTPKPNENLSRYTTNTPNAKAIKDYGSNGRPSCKTNQVWSSTLDRDSRTLYWDEVTVLSREESASVASLARRDSDTVILKGVKIDMFAQNKTTQPMYFRMALVHPKNNGNPTTAMFFRAYNTTRSIDFGDTGASSLVYRSDPINADEYDVIKTWSCTLGPSGDGGTNRNTGAVPAWQDWSEYVPINKTITYADKNPGTCNDKMFLVYWTEVAFLAGTSAVTVNSWQRQGRLVTYFRNP